jgi:hypothetical protein
MVDDFIGQYDNVLSEEQCKDIIKYFEQMKELNPQLVRSRQSYNDNESFQKDDDTIFLMEPEEFFIDTTMGILRPLMQSIYRCYNENYLQKYSILKTSSKHGVNTMRLQKVSPGQGYHMWHYENSGTLTANRIVAWMIYLNDIEEGGETEFLYLKKRIKPKAGKLLVWPAGYTHTHRGNQPLTEDKYIITGWFSFFD